MEVLLLLAAELGRLLDNLLARAVCDELASSPPLVINTLDADWFELANVSDSILPPEAKRSWH